MPQQKSNRNNEIKRRKKQNPYIRSGSCESLACSFMNELNARRLPAVGLSMVLFCCAPPPPPPPTPPEVASEDDIALEGRRRRLGVAVASSGGVKGSSSMPTLPPPLPPTTTDLPNKPTRR